MNSSIKESILEKIDKIENPILLQELELYLIELAENDAPSENTLLEQSINKAIKESELGLGVKHEQIWEQLN